MTEQCPHLSSNQSPVAPDNCPVQHSIKSRTLIGIALGSILTQVSWADYRVRSSSTWAQLNDWSRYSVYQGSQSSGIAVAYMHYGNLGTSEANRFHLNNWNAPDGLFLFPGPSYPSALRRQCVAFVRAVTDAPPTYLWRRGVRVMETNVAPGTLIATFDAWGNYSGEHCMIFRLKPGDGTLDGWSQNWPIGFGLIHHTLRPSGTARSNPWNYYVVDPAIRP